jgi:hypothetical protein
LSAAETIAKLNRKLQVKIKVATRLAVKEVIQIVIDIIKVRVRLEGEGKSGSFKELKESTIKYRERYAARLHPDTSPSTSNVTATGQMLDALSGKSSGNKVTIFIKDNKRRRELSGSKSKITNNQVRSYVEKEREFLVLSEQDKREVIEVAVEIIRQSIRDLLK